MKLLCNFLQDLNNKIKAGNRFILLFMYNFAAPTAFKGKHSNVEMKIFPVNTTSKLQQCAEEIMHSLKPKARLLMHKDSENVTLYEHLLMVGAAWHENVTAEVIKNGGSKFGIKKVDPEEDPTNNKGEGEEKSFMEGL